MQAESRSILYLDSYTTGDPAEKVASDASGYGITASQAIRSGLAGRGFEVSSPAVPSVADLAPELRSLSWALAGYRATLDTLVATDPDVVFVFHSFRTWPTQIRHLLLELGKNIPIVGYTHGSHWDPSDYVRTRFYPGLEMADLANLIAMDRVLLVSEYMRETLHHNISALSPRLADDLMERSAVVGLPINTALIDACRPTQAPDSPAIVFNHAPVASKNPQLFIAVMARILSDYDIQVLFTRGFDLTTAEGRAVADLHTSFPEQVVLGNNLSLSAYYEALWAADLQVSTAEHESLGIATLEAMYTGTCCILLDLGSYPEITGHDTEVLYPPGEEGLEERIRWFLDHPADRARAGERLRQQALRYTPEQVVGAIIAALP
ncbi:glycosyltransferase family 4 protein [Kocuria aegyptia]|uniref:Glycosyltransferase n=1 Tax=Kocuria aegyptia TaxID=330943 RepID=A0ABN2KIU0_9MICC